MTQRWPRQRLKFLCRFQYGDALPFELRDEDGTVPVFGSNGSFAKHSQPNTLAPAIIIGRKGSFGSISYSTEPAWCIDTAYWIDSRFSRASLRWLYYALQTLNLDTISQDTGVPGLSREAAYNCLVPVPSEEEQWRIADFLDRETAEADALVAKYERLIELLEEKRVALITRAVAKGLDPNVAMKATRLSSVGDIPSTWDALPAKRLLSFVTSGSRGWAKYYSDSGDLFLRITNLTRAGIDVDLSAPRYVQPPVGGEGERTRAQPGDLLISITADLGSVALVPDALGTAYVSQHVALCRPLPTVHRRWLAYAFFSQSSKAQFQQAGYGGTKIQLALDDVKNIVLPVPSPREQESIAEWIDLHVEELDDLLRAAHQAVYLVHERRSALITAVVTGQICVTAYRSTKQRVEVTAS